MGYSISPVLLVAAFEVLLIGARQMVDVWFLSGQKKKKLHLEETRMTWWALTKPKLWLVKRLTSWWSVKFSRLSQISDSSIAGRGELEILLLWGSWQEGSAGRAAKHTANRSGRRQIFSFQSRPWFNSCVLRLCYIRKYISSEKGEKKQYTSSDHWVAIQLNM